MSGANPHTTHGTPCIRVCVGDETVGYFTPAMTKRYQPSVERALAGAARVTAGAQAFSGTKGGATFWRLKVTMQTVD